MRHLPVPEPVARVAAAALETRAARGGGTARGLTIATALSSGLISAGELVELRDWHARHPDDVQGEASTLLAGLYGGAAARVEWTPVLARLVDVDGRLVAPHTAAALNPVGEGAMVALPVPDRIVAQVARPDGEPAGAMHLTLVHLSSDAASLPDTTRETIRDVVRSVVGGTLAPSIDLSHVERFTAGDSGLEPAVLVDDSPAVYALRQLLADALDAAGVHFSDDHAFRAHVTIGYYEPGDGPESGPIDASLGLDNLAFAPDAVELHWGGDVDRFGFAPVSVTAVTAAARSPLAERLATLSRAVIDTDQRLVARLHAAATHALEDATAQIARFVTRRTRTAVQRRGRQNAGHVAAVIAEAGGRITPPVLAALGLDEQDLLDHRFDTFAALATTEIERAQRRKLITAARAFELDRADLEATYGDEIDRRAAAAAAFMVGSLATLARRSLSGPVEVPAVGELSGPVPFRVVRSAFAIADRGASVALPLERGPGSATADITGRALRDAGRSLVGEIMAGQEAETGPIVSVKTWAHGDPLRAFEPHEALDGTSWDTDDYPEELAADPGEFPYVDVYEPDDHDGCTCFITEEWQPMEEPPGTGQGLADAIAADAEGRRDLVSF